MIAIENGSDVEVSVVIAARNAALWLDDCLQSVFVQQFNFVYDVSVYNDGSSDDTAEIINIWAAKFWQHKSINLITNGSSSGASKGVAFAKNQAVQQCRGKYLCFVDADDVCMPARLKAQHNAALSLPIMSLIGCKFIRSPSDSTARFTKWANGLSEQQLYTQCYTSHGPTLIAPTWFCSRLLFENVGGFQENDTNETDRFPEDLAFFYKALRKGCRLHCVDQVLVVYRMHPQCVTHAVKEQTIWNLRVLELEERVLIHLPTFTIWNAGKQGKRLYRSLSLAMRQRVFAFCDVDQRKIVLGYYEMYDPVRKLASRDRVQIVHYSEARPPFILCVKLGLTNGMFESILDSLGLSEGTDYFHFN